MSYFPKHYIVPNQYTNGGEFVYKGTSTIYIGPYFKTGNGKTFSGNTPQSPNIFEIRITLFFLFNKTKFSAKILRQL